MLDKLADVPKAIAAYYEEVETDGVTAVKLKPWGEVRSWGDVGIVIELCKPAEVYAKFVAMAVQGEHKAFHDAYLEWLEECAEIDAHNAGTYTDDEGKEQPNEQRSYSAEPTLTHEPHDKYNERHFKACRQAQVEALTVEVDGMVFDGDEKSQDRMSRAIVALKENGRAETHWRLFDNTVSAVTVSQLSEALLLAGEAQTAVWFPEG